MGRVGRVGFTVTNRLHEARRPISPVNQVDRPTAILEMPLLRSRPGSADPEIERLTGGR